ncbi:excisionase family DNA-binding protein [Aestuariimicrobium sp. p3-SID1156]|uniref:excisionase family DNA-binding protein n=1 Tax=Aestuariimicrobium sp. p3-SID1156 TaxID=2916038 RepID=UPI0037C132DD
MNAEQRRGDVESVQSAARRLGVCPRTARRMIADGRLPSYRIGDRLIGAQRADVDALVRRAT